MRPATARAISAMPGIRRPPSTPLVSLAADIPEVAVAIPAAVVGITKLNPRR